MTYFLALIAGIAGAAAGWCIGAFGGDAVAVYMGVSDFEGARGMLAAFVIGPIAGLIGLVLGAGLVLRYYGGHRSTGAIAGRIGLVVLGTGAIAAAVLNYLRLTGPVLNTDGPAPKLAFEIRLPPGASLDAKREVRMNTDKNTAEGELAGEPRTDAGRLVISGTIEVYYRSNWRLLVLKTPGEPERIFSLKLRASPGHMKEFSAWQAVDYVGEPGPQAPRRAGPEEAFEIRYRVIWPHQD